MDLEAAQDILEDTEQEDEYGAAIPEKPFMLHANGDSYNLCDPDQVVDLQESVKSDRNDLMADQLPKYEGRSTDWGGGGRARLLYDQVRADLAAEWHSGRHTMSWTEQHNEAMNIVRIRAIAARARY
jgi:hypothetical protein